MQGSSVPRGQPNLSYPFIRRRIPAENLMEIKKKKNPARKKVFLFWHALVRQLVKCANTSMHSKDYLIKTFPCACLSFNRPLKNKSQCVSFLSLFFSYSGYRIQQHSCNWGTGMCSVGIQISCPVPDVVSFYYVDAVHTPSIVNLSLICTFWNVQGAKRRVRVHNCNKQQMRPQRSNAQQNDYRPQSGAIITPCDRGAKYCYNGNHITYSNHITIYKCIELTCTLEMCIILYVKYIQ